MLVQNELKYFIVEKIFMSCVMISIIEFSLELFINFRISVDSKE